MSKKYENLCAKWDVTPKEIDEFMEFICGNHSLGDWYGSVNVIFAAADLMTRGDIPAEVKNGD